MPGTFELQGHRGARGRKPENTLPSVEAALDAGVTSIETDLHLTRDGVPVLCHDPFLDPRMVRRLFPGSPEPAERPRIRSLTLAQLRSYAADGNSDPEKFADQNADATPVAVVFAREHGVHPFAIPALSDLCAFVTAYAGAPGAAAGKTADQRRRAQRVRLDLEIKRVPFHPEYIDDGFDGERPGMLEKSLVEIVQRAGLIERTSVRSFDHRAVRAVCGLEPTLTGGVLIAHTTPGAAEQLVGTEGACVYCPSLDCVDESLIRRLHHHGIRVMPWTVNHEDDWKNLLSWKVDGITTDYPDRLADFLRSRGIPWSGDPAIDVAETSARPAVSAISDAQLLSLLRQTCMQLPEVRETVKWGHPTFEAGKKIFAVLDQYGGRTCIAFRASPGRRDELLKDPRFFEAPHGAQQGWLCLDADGPVDWGEVQTLLRESYQLVALKRMLAAQGEELELPSPPRQPEPGSRKRAHRGRSR